MKFISLIALFFTCFSSIAQCGLARHEVEVMLNPYIFDNATETRVQTYDRGYSQTITFSVFKGRAYKFAFEQVEGKPSDVQIIVSEFNKRTGEKKKIYDSEESSNMFLETMSESKHYTVDIRVKEKAKPGCVVIALGFKMKIDHIESKKRKGPKIKFK